MQITRRFSTKGQNPFDTVQYEKRKSVIRNLDGTSASITLDVEVPSSWSQVATDILAQKYLRRREVPQMDEQGQPILDEKGKPVLGAETSVKQVIDRLVGCWRHWGEEQGYFHGTEDAQAFYDEMTIMMLGQMGAPNSPQWFNTGLHYRYGITGSPQGHYYVDPKDGKLKQSKDAYTRPQPHACFIQSVEDDLLGENGIYSLMTREGRIFKYGSGTGTNFSSIRSSGEPLKGGGASSGLMSFLKVYDRSAGAIKSGGTTRRAAKMVCLDLDHPEVEDFITWKSREEAKVAALVAGSKRIKHHVDRILELGNPRNTQNGQREKLLSAIKDALDAQLPEASIKRALELAEQGISKYDPEIFDTHFEGKAYETASGQNSNNSIRVPNSFMASLQEDGDWNLTARTTGETLKTVKARSLWDKIASSAWECADPGMQFDDNINEWHTCPEDGRIRASNPCSEYMFLDDTACNLASLNLVHFQDEKGEFKIADFEHAVRLWTMVLEISVAMAQFPSKSIAQKSYDYRTLGLGYANLGTILMRAGIPYDSPKAAAITGAITAIMGGVSYATSAEMAGELGAFRRYEANKENMLRVIRNHRRAAYNEEKNRYEGLTVTPQGIDERICPAGLVESARTAWDRALELGEKNGYRNAQVTVIAPTGTIGLLMDCDTTGIEPDFALVKFKKLAGGGYFKIVNQSVPTALKHLGYQENEIRAITAFCKGHGSFTGAPYINPLTLKERGFSSEKITELEKSLSFSMDIQQLFSPYGLGADFLKSLDLGLDSAGATGTDVLKAMGFSESQIEEANTYVCGTQTIEGAPHLKEDHYPVFDCANLCGDRGTRFIAPMGHLRIMAAAQPFISGAISKTVNLPAETTIDGIKDIYMKSWGLMLKATALYRDGCKMSQPLNSTTGIAELIQQSARMQRPAAVPAAPAKELAAAQMEALAKLKRKKLPTKRHGITQEAVIGGHKVFLRTGDYPDGSLGEIFIDMYKEGASYRGLLNCFAVLASKALQYGVPLEELVDTFTFTRFEPSGPVEGHDNIKSCTSIPDFVFRALGLEYLGKDDFVHIKPESLPAPGEAVIERPKPNGNGNGKGKSSVHSAHSEAKMSSPRTMASGGQKSQPAAQTSTTAVSAYESSRKAGYTGETCGACGSLRVRRNGTCTVCDDCGSTSGCS